MSNSVLFISMLASYAGVCIASIRANIYVSDLSARSYRPLPPPSRASASICSTGRLAAAVMELKLKQVLDRWQSRQRSSRETS